MRFLTRNLVQVFWKTNVNFDVDHRRKGCCKDSGHRKPVLPPCDCFVTWWDKRTPPWWNDVQEFLSLRSGQTKRSVANVIVERIAQLQVLGKPRVIRSHLYRNIRDRFYTQLGFHCMKLVCLWSSCSPLNKLVYAVFVVLFYLVGGCVV